MPYPWPLPEADDLILEEALDIAMDYLEFTRQAYPFSETQRICAHKILQSWRRGTRHRIKLANDAINAIERRQAPYQPLVGSFYPRVS
jgi:hypothetical protein